MWTALHGLDRMDGMNEALIESRYKCGSRSFASEGLVRAGL